MKFALLTVASLFFLGCAHRHAARTSTESGGASAQHSQQLSPSNSESSVSRIEYSESCKEWSVISADDSLRSGFYRKEDTTVFVDKEKRVFVTLEGKSAPFYSDSSSSEWSFTSTATGFNAIEKERNLGSASPKPLVTLRDFLAASDELALRTQNSNRWISILLENETKVAVVLQGDLCSAQPKARYVTCSIAEETCSFFPKSFDIENEDPVARACLVDLKMNAPEKVQPLVKACEYFQSSPYEESKRIVLEKAARCGPQVERTIQSFPSLKRIEAACESIPSVLLKLTR